MTTKEQQITELITLTSRSITHLTATLTMLSFDLLRGEDQNLRGAGSRMLDRLEAVSKELDQHWKLIADLNGEQPPHRDDAVEEVHMHLVK
jgi:hypothetical protein